MKNKKRNKGEEVEKYLHPPFKPLFLLSSQTYASGHLPFVNHEAVQMPCMVVMLFLNLSAGDSQKVFPWISPGGPPVSGKSHAGGPALW